MMVRKWMDEGHKGDADSEPENGAEESEHAVHVLHKALGGVPSKPENNKGTGYAAHTGICCYFRSYVGTTTRTSHFNKCSVWGESCAMHYI